MELPHYIIFGIVVAILSVFFFWVGIKKSRQFQKPKPAFHPSVKVDDFDFLHYEQDESHVPFDNGNSY